MAGFEYYVLRDGWLKLPLQVPAPNGSTYTSGRLLLGLNQLLVRIAGKNILIDTGLGEKRAARDVGLLEIQTPRRLNNELVASGITPSDVDIVILSHLHYDHCGGATLTRAGKLAPSFTNAVYYLQQRELDYVRNLSDPVASSFFPDDFELLLTDGRLKMIAGDYEPLTGLKLHPTGGHTPGHQVVVVQSRAMTLFYPGDMFATRRHRMMKLSRRHNYDVDALNTQRKLWSERARAGGWSCFYCHELRNPVGQAGSLDRTGI